MKGYMWYPRRRREYQDLSDPTMKYPIIWYTISVVICTVILIILFNNQVMEEKLIVGLNNSQLLLRKTSPRFLSYGLDSSLLRDMKNLPLNDTRFVNLARHLSPAYVRVGGTSADCLFFNQTLSPPGEKIYDPVNGGDITNFTITDKDFIALSDFSEQSGARMIFDLNVLLRQPDGNWDFSNAEKIISYAKGHGLELDFQLGNEPNSFAHVFNRTVTATQLASDYIALRKLLDLNGYEASNLIGPEVNHIGDGSGEKYAKEFLKNNMDSVTYVSWHQYYLNGREAKVTDFINPLVFNYLPSQIESMANVIKNSGKEVYMWISETSSAYGGGAPKLSDRFVAGFLWLDKLGYSASSGVDVVTRQSFFGGNYALVSPDLTPNPDWWVSVAYKKFVSDKVLKIETPNNFGSLRLYAHCTPENALLDGVPAVTIYGVNLNKYPVRIAIETSYPELYEYDNLYLYILTANDLQSSSIKMNGETLKLEPNGELPQFKPVVLDPYDTIVLPPYSMAFIVLRGINLAACATYSSS